MAEKAVERNEGNSGIISRAIHPKARAVSPTGKVAECHGDTTIHSIPARNKCGNHPETVPVWALMAQLGARFHGMEEVVGSIPTRSTKSPAFQDTSLSRYSQNALTSSKLRKRILLSWSSGKDSAWSLHVLRQRAEYEVVGLLTTFNEVADRVAMHAVRRGLVERQAAAARLPLWAVPLPWPCSNEQYESLMAQVCAKAVSEGIEGVAFGDLFLEDVRAYREKQLKDTGLQPIFPLWGLPTRALAQEMIASGTRSPVDFTPPPKSF